MRQSKDLLFGTLTEQILTITKAVHVERINLEKNLRNTKIYAIQYHTNLVYKDVQKSIRGFLIVYSVGQRISRKETFYEG